MCQGAAWRLYNRYQSSQVPKVASLLAAEALILLGEEIQVGLIMIRGQRGTRFDRVFGPDVAEKVLRRAGRPVLIVDGRVTRGLSVLR
jgi:nucleotide-binding universal stress UspA family protein